MGTQQQEQRSNDMIKLIDITDSATRTAGYIIKYLDARKSSLEELRELVKENCILQFETEKQIKHLDVPPAQDTKTIIKKYEAYRKSRNKDLKKLPMTKLSEFDEAVQAMLDERENEEDTGDAEMQMRGGNINIIDPISKKRMVHPVKNIVCGHTYDRETITETLKINKNTRCPIVGCKSKEYVLLSNLKTDIVTQTYLENTPESS